MAVNCQTRWRKDCEKRLKVGRFLAPFVACDRRFFLKGIESHNFITNCLNWQSCLCEWGADLTLLILRAKALQVPVGQQAKDRSFAAAFLQGRACHTVQSSRLCEVVREVIIVNADLTLHWGCCWYLGGSEAQCKQVLCRHLRKQKAMKPLLRKFERH